MGCLQAYPGSRNVIPGEVRMTLDFRHLLPERLDSMIEQVRGVIEATCEEHGPEFRTDSHSRLSAAVLQP